MNYAAAKKWYYENKDIIPEMYKTVKIPKRNGKLRTLEIPNALLNGCQGDIKKDLENVANCSCYAEAYQKGKSLKNTVNKHINQEILVKLDIKNFFGSITSELVKRNVFQGETGNFMAELCCYNGHLPQGACTSPIISNLVMKNFDDELGRFCEKHGINYSRYSDDMFFSGSFNPGMIIRKVKEMLKKLGMKLNNEKTIVAGHSSRQMVLGVIVNEKMQLPSEYRRQIRQEVYYCSKYGVINHIMKTNKEKYIERDQNNDIIFVDIIRYLNSLIGKISYALYINPQDSKMADYYNTIHRLLEII